MWWWLIVTGVVVGLTTWVLVDQGDDVSPSRRVLSAAVLPFTTQTTEPEQGQLATGLSLDLLRRLQAVAVLQLSPRGQVAAWREDDTPRRLLAKELGAEILILGNVDLKSGRILLNLEVFDARNGTSIANLGLQESGERTLDLQRRAAMEVSRALQIQVESSEKARLRKDPTRSLMAWNFFAEGQVYLEDPTNPRGPAFAIDRFRRALQLDPEFAQAHVGLSQALWLGHLKHGAPQDLVEAELEARWVLSRDPKMGPAAVVLTQVLQTASRSTTMRSSMVGVVGGLRKPDEALRDVATGLLQVGKLELAEAAWRAAVDLGGDLWLNPFGLGQFLARGGRYGEATIAFSDAATWSPPGMTWPRESLTRLHLATGDLPAAIGVFETLDQPLDDLEAIFQIATAYVILNRLGEAEHLYRQVLDLDPSDARVHQELGDVVARQDRMQEALDLYTQGLAIVEEALEGSPSDSIAQLRFAVLAAKAQDCARALPMAATLRRHLDPSAETYHELAIAHAVCEDTPMAIDSWREALNRGLDPERIRSQMELLDLIHEAGLQKILTEAEGIPPSP